MTNAAVLQGKHILFACMPADGHFNPMTGLAMHLKSLGCDVRWYASETFAAKLSKLGIHRYRFDKALDVSADNIDSVFPEREHIKSQLKKLNFDMEHFFIRRAPEYLEDMQAIDREWKIDAVVADCLFAAIPYVKPILKVPMVSIGIVPVFQNSPDVAPSGLGLEPTPGLLGRIKHTLLTKLAHDVLFRKPNALCMKLTRERNIPPSGSNMFEMMINSSDVLLQSGTPSFEYRRSDLAQNIRYIGALLPYRKEGTGERWHDPRLDRYSKAVLVTQGTVEKDVSKLLVPAIEAFKDTDTLVIVTTGHSQTAQLRERFPWPNVLIEDFIPFDQVMPHVQLYISNGGYGGVMQAIQHGLPMLVAGVHEGKNEINARINYLKYGISLRTETPTAAQIAGAARALGTNPLYRENVHRLRQEFAGYDSNALFASYLQNLLTRRVLPAKAGTH